MSHAERAGSEQIALPVGDHWGATRGLLRTLHVTWADSLELGPMRKPSATRTSALEKGLNILRALSHGLRRESPPDSYECTLRIGPIASPEPETRRALVELIDPPSAPKTAYVELEDLLTALHQATDLHDLVRRKGHAAWLREAERAWDRNRQHTHDELVENHSTEDRFLLQHESAMFTMPGADPEGDDRELGDILKQRDEIANDLQYLGAGADRETEERKVAALENVARAVAFKSA